MPPSTLTTSQPRRQGRPRVSIRVIEDEVTRNLIGNVSSALANKFQEMAPSGEQRPSLSFSEGTAADYLITGTLTVHFAGDLVIVPEQLTIRRERFATVAEFHSRLQEVLLSGERYQIDVVVEFHLHRKNSSGQWIEMDDLAYSRSESNRFQYDRRNVADRARRASTPLIEQLYERILENWNHEDTQ